MAAGCAACLGAARFQAAQPIFDLSDLASYNDLNEYVEVTGWVKSPPISHDSYVELHISAIQLSFENHESQPVHGELLAEVDLGGDWKYGDQVSLRGKLATPEDGEDFSYKDYLSRQGIYALMAFPDVRKIAGGQGNLFWAAMYGLRQHGLETLNKIYPSQEASLFSGILLGDESRLSEKVKTAFNDAGTRHIIAISGFNISIIAGLFLLLFSRWLGQRRGVWMAGAAVGLYTFLVGADPAVVRAAIMGLVGLLALRTGRQPLAINTLAVTAAAMAVVNPMVLWDVGFQLSFAATLGLILFADPISNWSTRWLEKRASKDFARRLRGPLQEYLFMTLAAQITTLPLLLFYFQRLSIYSLPANVLVLPVQPAVMILGGLSMLAGMLWLPLGQIAAFFGWGLAAYTIRITQLFAGLPGAGLTLAFPLVVVLIYYAGLAIATLKPLRQWIRQLRLQPAVALGIACAMCLWIWSAALAAPNGMLTITMLDVDGEAILIRTPTGRNLLINTGSSASELADELRPEMPLGQKLDWLLLSGRRGDQIGALAGGLDWLPFGNLAFGIGGEDAQAISAQSAEMDVPTVELQAGDHFELGSGAGLDVLARGPRGSVLLVSWKQFKALLPLGLDFDLLDMLDEGNGVDPVSLLVLADGGYAPLNPPEWIANLSPTEIWIAGSAQETAELAAGFPSAGTQEHGWLRATTDGSKFWLEAAR